MSLVFILFYFVVVWSSRRLSGLWLTRTLSPRQKPRSPLKRTKKTTRPSCGRSRGEVHRICGRFAQPRRYLSIYKDGVRACGFGTAWVKQLDRSDDAALPSVHERGRDRRLSRDFCRSVFPSPVRDACGLRGGSGCIRKVTSSNGVHRWE